MKIAYINTFYAPDEIGGAEKSVRFLAEAMITRGHEATVIALGRERQSTCLNGVRIEKLKPSNLYFPADAGGQPGWRKMLWHGLDAYNVPAGREVGRLLDQIAPDVVHTNNPSGLSVSIWQAAHRRGIPIVHTLRDYYLLCPKTAMYKNDRQCSTQCSDCKVLSLPKKPATAQVDAVVGNSHFILNKHCQAGLFPRADKKTIYNAYAPTLRTNKSPDGRVTLGFIGRIAPTKGVNLLIDALRDCVATHPQVELLIAGEGDPNYVDDLKRHSADLPIRFMGRVKPESFYTMVDWTIVPSLWDEPLARVIFESFAHGVPVIGSKTGGTPELVKHCLNGYLFEPHKDDLVATLRLAMQTNGAAYAALKQHGIEQAATFHPDHVASQYEQTYALVSRKPAALQAASTGI